MVWPVFLYGTKSWTLQDGEKQDTLGVWCWRKMFGIMWAEFCTKESIFEQMKIVNHLFCTMWSHILAFWDVFLRWNLSEYLVMQPRVKSVRPHNKSPMRCTGQGCNRLSSTYKDQTCSWKGGATPGCETHHWKHGSHNHSAKSVAMKECVSVEF